MTPRSEGAMPRSVTVLVVMGLVAALLVAVLRRRGGEQPHDRRLAHSSGSSPDVSAISLGTGCAGGHLGRSARRRQRRCSAPAAVAPVYTFGL